MSDDFQQLKNASFEEAQQAASSARQTVNSAIHGLHSTAKQAHAVNQSIRDLKSVSAASLTSSAKTTGGDFTALSRSARKTLVKTDALHSLQRRAGSTSAHLSKASSESLSYAKNLKQLDPTMAKAMAARMGKGVKGSVWAKLPKKALKGGVKTLGKAGLGAVNGAAHYAGALDDNLGEITNIGEGRTQVAGQVGRAGLKTIRGGVKSIRFATPRAFHPARSLREVKLRSSMLRQQSQILRNASRNLHGVHRVRAVLRAVRKNMESHLALIGGVGGIILAMLSIILVLVLFTALIGGHQAECADSGASSGGTVKAANFGSKDGVLPGLKINSKASQNVLDWRGMGIPNHAAYSYDFEQCTWWVAVRLHQLGVTPEQYMGDGAVQATNLSKKPGWRIVKPGPHNLRLGDVISFKPGVMGADPVHGHVAVVEKVTDGDPDKSYTSEGGVNFFQDYGGPLMMHHPGLANTWETGGIIVARYMGKVKDSTGDTSDPANAATGCPADTDSGANIDGVAPATSGQKKDEQDYALSKFGHYGWNPDRNGSDFKSLVTMWTKESGWSPAARNASSGACGIPQALPCSKIPNPKDWHSQIDWGLSYIKGRYGTPTNAWRLWQTQGWY